MKHSFCLSALLKATAILGLLALIPSCDDKQPEEPKIVSVTAVSLDQTTLALTEGESQTLAATVKPDNADNKAVTWASSDPAVATVSASGTVTAVKAGTASITVTTKDGGKTASCQVTVTAKTVAVTGVTVDPTTLTLTEGGSQSLTATVKPDNATNKAVEWKSSATAVATVDASGKVTAVKAGTADITVTTKDGGKTATCKLTVTAKTVAVTSISFVKTPGDLYLGETGTCEVKVNPGDATDKTIEWSVSNPSVATIKNISGTYNQTCTIQPLTNGTVELTAKNVASGKSNYCTIRVLPNVTSLKITSKNNVDNFIENGMLHLTEGESYVINTEVKVEKEECADKTIDWWVEYPDYISVTPYSDGRALVKALKPTISGSALFNVGIVATSNENKRFNDNIFVFVHSKPTDITCSATSDWDARLVKQRDSKTLQFTISPSTARQRVEVMKAPTANGTWTYTASGTSVKVTCPADPGTDSRDFFQNAHSFLFYPIGAKAVQVQVSMYPCEYYASDVKPMDYLYYDSGTKKLRSSDGGLRTYRNGTFKLMVYPSPKSTETTVGIITYVGTISDSRAKSEGVLTGLSNGSGIHGLAMGMDYASTSCKWSTDHDDVSSSSNWPSGYPFPDYSDIWTDKWQNVYSYTEAAIAYNIKRGDSHDIQPIEALITYAKNHPAGDVPNSTYNKTHWVMPTMAMGRIGTSSDATTVMYHLGYNDNSRLSYFNNNMTAANGKPYDKQCWSICFYSSNYAWPVWYPVNSTAVPMKDKNEKLYVRPWLLF